jgi:hypothetical protein
MSSAPRVFLTQRVPFRDYSDARRFGQVFTPNSQSQFFADEEWKHSEIAKVLQREFSVFRPQDYLLAQGDPAVIAAAVAYLFSAGKVSTHLNLLKWDRENSRYYAVKIYSATLTASELT